MIRRHTSYTVLEQFSTDQCHKTKTKVNALANHKAHRQYSEPITKDTDFTVSQTQL